MNLKIALLTPIFIFLLSIAALGNVFAIEVIIEGNADGSSNSVNIDQQDTTTYDQNNTYDGSTNVDANCNTGGNSASGNTSGNAGTSTGNCDVSVDIQNNVNSNCIGANCLPADPNDPSVPPIGGSGGGGSNGGGGSSSSGGGGSGSSGPEVLGETGTAENLAFATGGMGLILSGLWFARKSFVKAL